MSTPNSDKVFTGSIPALYETYLVPPIFETYAADLANRLVSRSLTRVLEIAAGTGVVTRNLASVLPESVTIVATDLNQQMLSMKHQNWCGFQSICWLECPPNGGLHCNALGR